MIATVQTIDEAVELLSPLIKGLVRNEGFCGVGKTKIAQSLAEATNSVHIEGDQFVDKCDLAIPYSDHVRLA